MPFLETSLLDFVLSGFVLFVVFALGALFAYILSAKERTFSQKKVEEIKGYLSQIEETIEEFKTKYFQALEQNKNLKQNLELQQDIHEHQLNETKQQGLDVCNEMINLLSQHKENLEASTSFKVVNFKDVPSEKTEEYLTEEDLRQLAEKIEQAQS